MFEFLPNLFDLVLAQSRFTCAIQRKSSWQARRLSTVRRTSLLFHFSKFLKANSIQGIAARYRGTKFWVYDDRMTNLQALDSMELHQHTQNAAADEKRATLHLLECLHWVETRKVHLERGYSSLFAYVCGALGYSESQASERIRAMRLAHSVPEIKEQIERGAMNLTTAARVATHATRLKLSEVQVSEILPLIAHQSTRELERTLLKRESAAGLAPRERIKENRDWTEIQVALTPQAADLLKQARELDANPGIEIAAVLEKALSAYVSAKRHEKQALLKKSVSRGALHVTESVGQGDRKRQIPRPIRREVWKRAEGKCQYHDEMTGKVCGTTHALTFEHRTPYAQGGPHTEENLALFCAAQNAHSAERVFGMGPKFKKAAPR